MLGQKVCTKNEPYHKGTVTAVAYGDDYLAGRDIVHFGSWNRKYPDWVNSLVLIIELDEPQVSCTFEQFKDSLVNTYGYTQLTDDKLKDMYSKEVSYVHKVAIPLQGVNFENNLHNIYLEIIDEREYQDKKWGGKPFDLQHSEAEWLKWIDEYTQGKDRAAKYDFRTRMIKGAALCIAAIEAIDMKNQPVT